MKTKYVMSFIDAIKEIVDKEIGVEMTFEKPHRREDEYFKTEDVVIIIGFGGGAMGQMVMSMDEESAMKIAGGMMKKEVFELDSTVRSALGELGNIISAKAASGLTSEGFKCEITPPSLVIGKEVKIKVHKDAKVILVPIKLGESSIDINIAFRRNEIDG